MDSKQGRPGFFSYSSRSTNKGKLQADTTVADQYIKFPTYAKLLNSSVLKMGKAYSLTKRDLELFEVIKLVYQ